MVTEGPHACYHCQRGVKELSGEQESRRVSPRISEGQIYVQKSSRVVFLLDRCMGTFFSFILLMFLPTHTETPEVE